MSFRSSVAQPSAALLSAEDIRGECPVEEIINQVDRARVPYGETEESVQEEKAVLGCFGR